MSSLIKLKYKNIKQFNFLNNNLLDRNQVKYMVDLDYNLINEHIDYEELMVMHLDYKKMKCIMK
jgi:galactokinase